MIPLCSNCQEPGERHQWKVRRYYGRCPDKQSKYEPDTDAKIPLNRLVGKLTVSEAGRKGGRKTKQRGPEYYREIGRMGLAKRYKKDL